MPKLNRCAIAIFTILSAISSPTLLANINEPSGEAADIISQVADSHAINITMLLIGKPKTTHYRA